MMEKSIKDLKADIQAAIDALASEYEHKIAQLDRNLDMALDQGKTQDYVYHAECLDCVHRHDERHVDYCHPRACHECSVRRRDKFTVNYFLDKQGRNSKQRDAEREAAYQRQREKEIKQLKEQLRDLGVECLEED